MGVETSNLKHYVFTGPLAIRTEDGVRTNIDAGDDTSRPFLASIGWLKQHRALHHRLQLLSEYEAQKAEAKKAKPTTAKAAEKPAKAAKKVTKKSPKTKE